MIFIFYLWYDGCSFAIWETRVRVTETTFLKYLNIRLRTLTLPKPALVGVLCIRYTLLCGKCFGSHERWTTHTSLHWSHLSWWTPYLSRITLLVEFLWGTEAAEILYESLFLDKHSYSCYLEVISSHICHKHYITICECRWCHGSPVHRYGLYALQWIVEVNGKLTPDLGTFLEVVKVCLMLCTHGSVIKFKIL